MPAFDAMFKEVDADVVSLLERSAAAGISSLADALTTDESLAMELHAAERIRTSADCMRAGSIICDQRSVHQRLVSTIGGGGGAVGCHLNWGGCVKSSKSR
eukprot:7223738-Prymnesium_polylepis.1